MSRLTSSKLLGSSFAIFFSSQNSRIFTATALQTLVRSSPLASSHLDLRSSKMSLYLHAQPMIDNSKEIKWKVVKRWRVNLGVTQGWGFNSRHVAWTLVGLSLIYPSSAEPISIYVGRATFLKLWADQHVSCTGQAVCCNKGPICIWGGLAELPAVRGGHAVSVCNQSS